MADVATGGQCEGRMEMMERELERLDHQVNGNGQEGLVQKLDRVLSWQARTEGNAEGSSERERQHHRQNTLRLNLIIGVLTVFALYFALFKH